MMARVVFVGVLLSALLVPRSAYGQADSWPARSLLNREIAVAVAPNPHIYVRGTVIGTDTGFIQLRMVSGDVAHIVITAIASARLRVPTESRWRRAWSGAAVGAFAGGLGYYLLNQSPYADQEEYLGVGVAVIGAPIGAAIGFAVGYATSRMWRDINITR